MPRTLLYYPTLTIPNHSWLRDAILYWDNVGSIVPPTSKRVVDNNDSLKYLEDEGIFKRFDPEDMLQQYSIRDEFIQDFAERLNSVDFAAELTRDKSGEHWNIAIEKMATPIWELLFERKLTPDPVGTPQSVRVKRPAAIIYMGLLARYVSLAGEGAIQPSTDQSAYEDILYRCSTGGSPLPGMSLALYNVLPRTSADTELLDLVEFKKHRRDELLRLRVLIDDTQVKLSSCEDLAHAKLMIEQFKEHLELEYKTIERLMSERGIKSIVGTLRAIFSAKSPAWAAGAATGAAGGLFGGLPVAAVSARCGFVAGGLIELAHYGLEIKNTNRCVLEHPLSYLYSAKMEGIV